MANEGYKKRLEDWEKTQKRTKEQQEPDKPYEPEKMRVRIPFGCIAAGILVVLSIVFLIKRLMS